MLFDPKWETKVETPAIEPYQVLLLHAATLLETRGWIQKAWRRFDGICTGQAINDAATELGLVGDVLSRAVNAMIKAIDPMFPVDHGDINYIAGWNDFAGRTKEQCVEKLRLAARG
jgi:hypothetical protein